MLSFICGTSGCGKRDEIYRRAEADAAAGKNAYILVPEQYSMYTEQELLLRLGMKSQSRIQILTFSRLCNLIFSHKGPLRIKYVDKASKYMLARKAMQSVEKDLTMLRSNIYQQGFAKLAVSAISEFKRYGVLPSQLRSAADNTTDVRLGMKLRDLSLIYEKFDDITNEGYCNSEDNLSIAIPKIKDCAFLAGTVFVDFFRSFTPAEYDAITELMKKADICVSLCTDTVAEENSVFFSQVHMYKKLRKIAEENGVQIGDDTFLREEKRLKDSPELLHIKHNFFADVPSAYGKNPQNVAVYRPNNYYDEVSCCAKLITRLCREEGYSFNDFLVLTGSMENYERIIPAVFEEFGIKHFLDKKMCITESPFMRMMMSVFEILAYGFSYERVMRIVRSGFFVDDKKKADMFENYILAVGVSHKQWNSHNKWTYNPDKKIYDMDTVNEVREKVVTPVLELEGMFKGRKTISEICKNICIWLTNKDMPATVSQRIDTFNEEKLYEIAELLRLAWNSFASVIQQMSDCLGDEKVTFVDFYEILAAACEELTVGMVPPTQDKVIISEAEHFRSTGSRVVIVLGVNDSVFPRAHKNEGIISDAERAELLEKGLELAPDIYNRQREGEFLTYSVLTTAEEKLFLFSPMGDKDGKSLESSEVVRRLCKKLFPAMEIRSSEGVTEIDGIEGKEHIFYELSAKLFEQEGQIEKLTPLWKEIYKYYSSDDEYSERLKNIERMASSREEARPLDLKTAKKLYGSPLILSVSKLERYNSCAFSFFMKYGLLARERQIGGFEANDMGTILHAVLCEYFKDKTQRGIDYGKISYDACCEDISELVKKVSDDGKEILYKESAYYKYITERIKGIASMTAWKLVKFYAQSSFRPDGFELKIGRDGDIPACEMNLEKGKVCLEGFIDRMDSADIDGKRYVTITDYKSSEKKIDTRLVEAGVSFQPLMYANMIKSAQPDVVPAAMTYMQMNDPILRFDTEPNVEELEKEVSDSIKINGIVLNEPEVIRSLDADFGDKNAVHYIPHDKNSVLSKAELEMKLETAQKKAEQTAGEIMDGKIDVNPVNIVGFDPCHFCPYNSVCSGECERVV